VKIYGALAITGLVACTLVVDTTTENDLDKKK
jgi:hypothetical protein